MYFIQILLGAALIVQIYYLYEFIYSIPMKTDEHIQLRLRGERLFTDNFREKHTRKPLPQQLLKQTNRDNNTALIYRFAANLGAVSRF